MAYLGLRVCICIFLSALQKKGEKTPLDSVIAHVSRGDTWDCQYLHTLVGVPLHVCAGALVRVRVCVKYILVHAAVHREVDRHTQSFRSVLNLTNTKHQKCSRA